MGPLGREASWRPPDWTAAPVIRPGDPPLLSAPVIRPCGHGGRAPSTQPPGARWAPAIRPRWIRNAPPSGPAPERIGRQAHPAVGKVSAARSAQSKERPGSLSRTRSSWAPAPGRSCDPAASRSQGRSCTGVLNRAPRCRFVPADPDSGAGGCSGGGGMMPRRVRPHRPGHCCRSICATTIR